MRKPLREGDARAARAVDKTLTVLVTMARREASAPLEAIADGSGLPRVPPPDCLEPCAFVESGGWAGLHIGSCLDGGLCVLAGRSKADVIEGARCSSSRLHRP